MVVHFHLFTKSAIISDQSLKLLSSTKCLNHTGFNMVLLRDVLSCWKCGLMPLSCSYNHVHVGYIFQLSYHVDVDFQTLNLYFHVPNFRFQACVCNRKHQLTCDLTSQSHDRHLWFFFFFFSMSVGQLQVNTYIFLLNNTGKQKNILTGTSQNHNHSKEGDALLQVYLQLPHNLHQQQNITHNILLIHHHFLH